MNEKTTAPYPDSTIRREYLKTIKQEDQHSAGNAIHWTLRHTDRFTFKIYRIRDESVQLMKDGHIEEAIKLLNTIGT